jgi:hypothetical protein
LPSPMPTSPKSLSGCLRPPSFDTFGFWLHRLRGVKTPICLFDDGQGSDFVVESVFVCAPNGAGIVLPRRCSPSSVFSLEDVSDLGDGLLKALFGGQVVHRRAVFATGFFRSVAWAVRPVGGRIRAAALRWRSDSDHLGTHAHSRFFRSCMVPQGHRFPGDVCPKGPKYRTFAELDVGRYFGSLDSRAREAAGHRTSGSWKAFPAAGGGPAP